MVWEISFTGRSREGRLNYICKENGRKTSLIKSIL